MAQSAQGLDVSNFQGHYNWAATSGLSFGIHRLTQGLPADHTNSPDPTAAWNHAEIAKKGLIRGAYHFLNPAESGAAQAQHFVTQYSALGFSARDMFWLDNEDPHGQPPAKVAACALAFMQELGKLVPHNPRGVYTFISFAKEGNCAGLGSYPLWLAFPSTAAPAAPPPWERWTFWQWGQHQGTDADAFNGTPEGLAAWVASFAPAPAKPPAPAPAPAPGPGGSVVADGHTSLRDLAHAHGSTAWGMAVATIMARGGKLGDAEQLFLSAIFNGTLTPDAAPPKGTLLWA